MSTVNALREDGHEVVHLRELALHTLPDEQIPQKAFREGFVVLTFDLDFGDLLAASGMQMPSVILFRLRNQTPRAVNPRLRAVLAASGEPLKRGALIVVEDQGFRVRQLPIVPI